MAGSFHSSVARGVAWVSVAAAVVAALDLLSLALILKYWATAREFGTVSIAITMFGALQLLGEAGLPAAVVQRDDDSDDRLSTVYWLGLVTGAALYALIWIAAPRIAAAYELPELVALIRLAGLLLVIRPVYTTHQGLLRRQLRFREISIMRVIANLVEAAFKLGTAVAGGGVLAFVLGPLARELMYALQMPRALAWRPTYVLRPSLVRDDYRFGLRATGGELLFQFYSNLDYQVVAFAFGATALGIYRAAYELVLEPVRYASGVITVVAFPAFARLRTDASALAEQFVTFTRQNLAFVLVMVGAIVVSAEDLLVLTLDPTYAVATDAARVLAIVAVFRALSHLGPPLLDGVGRPDLTLRYQAAAATVVSSAFLIAAWLGSTFFAVAIAWAAAYPLAFALLGRMVLAQIGLSPGAFALRIAPQIARIAVATALGGLVHLAAGGQGPALRLALTAPTLVAAALLLRRLGR